MVLLMKTLECSSRGDKRFSAFHAKVDVFGIVDTIENHYQLCKRFGSFIPKTWKDAKGKKPTHIVVDGRELDVRFLTPYYKYLWMKYLDQNPELVEYAKQFDNFTDMFRGKSINCQADVIKRYVKEGRFYVLEECEEFIRRLLRVQTRVVHCKKEPYDVYIGRPSEWGNPYSEKQYGRNKCIQMYLVYLLRHPKVLKEVKTLRGKVLGCWCRPKKCHGDILAMIADMEEE